MRLSFLGGTGTVTGSKYLLERDRHRILIDCGLFQGLKQLRLRNWREFTVAPSSIDAIVLTHAHLDHSGFIPRLTRLGFRGRVFATPATCELAELLLVDSAYLQEEQADYANRHGFAKHRPALPLYSDADARRALELFHPQPFDQAFEPVPGVSVSLHRAGAGAEAEVGTTVMDAGAQPGSLSGHGIARDRAMPGRSRPLPIIRPPSRPVRLARRMVSFKGERTAQDQGNRSLAWADGK